MCTLMWKISITFRADDVLILPRTPQPLHRMRFSRSISNCCFAFFALKKQSILRRSGQNWTTKNRQQLMGSFSCFHLRWLWQVNVTHSSLMRALWQAKQPASHLRHRPWSLLRETALQPKRGKEDAVHARASLFFCTVKWLEVWSSNRGC